MTESFHEETREELIAYLIRASNNIHVVSIGNRTGFSALNSLIEFSWYRPNTPSAHLFEVRAVPWHGVVFLISSFPRIKFPAIKNFANILGLTILEGAPTIMPVDAHDPYARYIHKYKTYGEFFPGFILPGNKENRAMYSLEYLPGFKHELPDAAVHRREGIINVALQNGKKLTPKLIADYIYGRDNNPVWLRRA